MLIFAAKRIFEMKKTLLTWICLVVVLAVKAQMVDPVHFTAELKTSDGAEAEIVFHATIDPGWHVYSTEIGEDGPIEATFNVVKMEGAEAVGKLTPKGNVIKKMDKLFGMELKYFEGEATFVQKIRFTKPEYDIDCYLEYGACSDASCMPPSEVELKQSGKSPVIREKGKVNSEEFASATVSAPAEKPNSASIAGIDSASVAVSDSASVKSLTSDLSPLTSDYDAVVISTGTPTARDLKAPGRELKGVHFALEMLSQQNRVLAGMEFSKDERVTAKGKDVLVIGGGDTGSDCIGTAHRQGCKSVTQIEIMPKPVEGPEDPQNPWPEWPRTLKTTSSHEEGCTRRWNINTLEFLGENGKLTGVKVQEIDWKPNPEGGRPIMVEKGKPEIIKAELVLLAMGFLKPEHPEYPKNVFVCGDSANGASLVVRAMASGRQAAAKVAAFLER